MSGIQPLPVIFGASPPNVECRDRQASYAVICNQQRHVAAVCVDVRGRDEFWLPGGGMHYGESPEQTIEREIREELGRRVTVRRPIGRAVQFFFAGDEECWYRMTAHFYSAQLSGEPDGRGEFELHWIDSMQRQADFFHECHAWAASTELRSQANDLNRT